MRKICFYVLLISVFTAWDVYAGSRYTQVFSLLGSEFDQIEEGVYGEKNNKNRFFFVLNKQLEFEELSAGIQNIKSNCDFHLFDTFLSSIYLNSSIIDFIGIYSDHCDKNRFGELKENINKIFNN